MNPRTNPTPNGVTRALRHCEHASRARPAALAGMGLGAIFASVVVWVVNEIVSLRTGRSD